MGVHSVHVLPTVTIAPSRSCTAVRRNLRGDENELISDCVQPDAHRD